MSGTGTGASCTAVTSLTGNGSSVRCGTRHLTAPRWPRSRCWPRSLPSPCCSGADSRTHEAAPPSRRRTGRSAAQIFRRSSNAGCDGVGVPGGGGGASSLRHATAYGSSTAGCSEYPVGQVGPAGPAGPVAPTGPAGPGTPCGPAGPGAPVGPASPTAPGAPGEPVALAPTGPVGPDGPEGPGAPGGPDGPTSPRGPGSPVPTGPGSPRLPGGPATGDAPSCCTCCANASRA